ncbi:MAG: prepilin-type N-terminal cleavage/methylation domain-containing protein [Rickettsiales bacterium]
MKSLHKNFNHKAFTLIELAVVLVIIGLISGSAFYLSRDIIESSKRVATENRLDTIEKALFTFWQKNGRLPCPADATLAKTDSNYGVEAVNTNDTCEGFTPAANFSTNSVYKYKAAEGAVPITTLGLPKDFIYDGWNRKVAYAVNPEFVITNAKGRILLKSSECVANTSIRIKDASGAYRSNSAVYALISYGKNGHGAYPKTGSTRYNSGSTNTDELANCHCDSSAADTTYYGDYIQRSNNLNEVTAANYFDDIVRYKERWQLTTDEDMAGDDGYRGPDLAVAYVKTTTGTVYTYKNQCGAFIKQADLEPLPTNEVMGIAFTAGNKHLLTYSAAGCNLYKIDNDGTLTDLPNAFDTACTYNSTAVMELSNNGYLAISSGTSSPTIHLWKQSGDKFIALADLTHTNNILELSFSHNANLLAIRSATNTSKIYKRKGDSFSSAAADITQPTGFTSINPPASLTFSPDGNYLSIAGCIMSGGFCDNYLKSWRIRGDSTYAFIPLADIFLDKSSGSFFTIYKLKFSPNSNYLIYDSWSSRTYIRKIEHDDVITTNLVGFLVFDSGGSDMSFSFSRNSNYMISSRGRNTDLVGLIPATPVIFVRKVGYVSQMNGYFQADGTAGTIPIRMLDQVLADATGGPAAFAH